MSRRRLMATLTVGLLALAGCGGDGGGEGEERSVSAATGEDAPYGAQVASYDLGADGPQRFLVGLIANDGGTLVGGEVLLDFRHLAAAPAQSGSSDDAPALEDVVARFVPVAGGVAPPAGEGPRLREFEEGVGVYEVTDIRFDRPGNWEVTVRATASGRPFEVQAAFNVLPQSQIVGAGDPAPRTVNPLAGSPDTPPQAIDSRADGAVIPDPELHRTTVADAMATGRPTLVVVSTPVFCVSRFCGPITDSVQAIAGEFAGRANFVHLEVWKDFEKNVLNKAAAEWIYPNKDVDPFEPWVFLVGGDGTVVQRWDNVADQGSMRAAIEALTG